MTAVWITVAGLVATTAAIRAAGPVALGGRELPPRAMAIVSLLAPALLAALVVTQTFGDGDDRLVLDERAIGVGAAAAALALRAPILVAIVLAAAVTAAARAL